MSDYQNQALIQITPWLFPMAFVIAVYLGALKADWCKRILIAIPSILFIVLPVFAVITTPDAPQFDRFMRLDVWNIVYSGFYLLAFALVVLNLFYIRTWLNLLQVLNISFAVLSYCITVLAVTGDAP